ncbi:MAG: DUF484 family protein [Burkholderiales bacterium]|nr:DUF484 family protein [Burkholderiales bacterium]
MTLEGAITETDIANYLANTPGFFERHAELLATIQLTSPHGQRAVSLQERQMEMQREKVRGLERKIMEMIRHGQENVAIADRLHRWTRAILMAPNPAALPDVLLATLKHEFLIPQAALRLWGVEATFVAASFTQGVSPDTLSFAVSLVQPYCGANAGFEATTWLADPAAAASVALIPLHRPGRDECFGLMVLGSPDPTRYTADMGTEFLQRVGEIASAGLSRLLPQA